MNSVELPRTLAIELLQMAQQAPGGKVCGLISARGGIPVRVHRLNDTGTKRSVTDELDNLVRQLRNDGEKVFASWQAQEENVPPMVFLEHLPDCAHLVVSLQTRGVLQLAGWRLENGEPRQLPVITRDQAG